VTAGEPDLPPGFEVVTVPGVEPPAEAASSTGRRRLADLWRMSAAVARHRLDLFFFPSVYTFFPLVRPVRSIVTVHDVIAEHHPHLVFAEPRLRRAWRLKVAVAIRQARVILTVSEHARAGIVEHFRLAPARVRVILEAADPVFRPSPAPPDAAAVLPQCGLPRGCRYLLYVGGLSPHKNLPVLLEAFRRVRAEPDLADLRLLLVGDHTGDVFLSAGEALRAIVRRDGMEDRVCFTGFVADATLRDLYGGASLVVLPSLEEGFGLPAVEAAGCGSPVVASDAGPIGELLGPGAWTFPPRDVEALTGALRALLRDPGRRRAMGEEGRRRAALLTWDRAAGQVRALFHEVAGG
jgi:glycosyltransferase involved in cell wall biosynthesis